MSHWLGNRFSQAQGFNLPLLLGLRCKVEMESACTMWRLLSRLKCRAPTEPWVLEGSREGPSLLHPLINAVHAGVEVLCSLLSVTGWKTWKGRTTDFYVHTPISLHRAEYFWDAQWISQRRITWLTKLCPSWWRELENVKWVYDSLSSKMTSACSWGRRQNIIKNTLHEIFFQLKNLRMCIPHTLQWQCKK